MNEDAKTEAVGKKLSPEEMVELFGDRVTSEGVFLPPKPKDSHDHGTIEDSDLTETDIRAECAQRVNDLADAWPTLIDAVELEDREGLTRVLANLNAALMHISDPFGC